MLENLTTSFPLLKSLGGVAGISVVIAAIVTGWSHITAFFRSISDIIFVRMMYTGETAKAVQSYVNSKGSRFRLGLRVFSGGKVYLNPLQRVEVVGYEIFSSQPALIKVGRRCFLLGIKGDSDKTSTSEGYSDDTLRLTTIRGLFDMDAFALEAIEHYNHLHRSVMTDDGDDRISRFKVVRVGRSTGTGESKSNNGPERNTHAASTMRLVETNIRTKTVQLLKWQVEDIGMKTGTNAAFNIFFYPPDIMAAVDEVRSWRSQEAWFKTKGINWRLGWLIHGKPGTGKSTLVRSIAMDLDMPVFVLDLSGLDNNTFTDIWQEIQQNAPAIALIEDIDGVFNKRTNITAKAMVDSLTFDCLLNTISGVNNGDGVFTVITTNDMSSLDPAIGLPEAGKTGMRSSRPGRMDRIITLTAMRREERVKVAEHVLSGYPDLIASAVDEGENESAAQFQDRCTQLALHRLRQEQKIVSAIVDCLPKC